MTPLDDGPHGRRGGAHRRAEAAGRRCWFDAEGVAPASRSIDLVLDARYVGQNFELAVRARRRRSAARPPSDRAALLRRARARLRLPQSGRPDRDRELPPDRRSGSLRQPAARPAEPRRAGTRREPHRAGRSGSRPMPRRTTPVYDRASLLPGDTIAGPAVIEQLDSTTLLFPGDRATVDPHLNLMVEHAHDASIRSRSRSSRTGSSRSPTRPTSR